MHQSNFVIIQVHKHTNYSTNIASKKHCKGRLMQKVQLSPAEQ